MHLKLCGYSRLKGERKEGQGRSEEKRKGHSVNVKSLYCYNVHSHCNNNVEIIVQPKFSTIDNDFFVSLCLNFTEEINATVQNVQIDVCGIVVGGYL